MVGDEMAERCIVLLNMVAVKLMARKAMLEGIQDNAERIRDDLDKFTRAMHHCEAAISFIQQTHYAPEEVDLELPFDWD